MQCKYFVKYLKYMYCALKYVSDKLPDVFLNLSPQFVSRHIFKTSSAPNSSISEPWPLFPHIFG